MAFVLAKCPKVSNLIETRFNPCPANVENMVRS